jgi:PAS domain S-box-containing protein
MSDAVAVLANASKPRIIDGMAGDRRTIELTKTLEKVNVPSAITNEDGVVTWANEAAVDVFGDRVGEPFTNVVAPEYRPLVERQLRQKLEGAAVTDYQVDVYTLDGARRRAEISSVPIHDGDRCHAVFGIAVLGSARPAARDELLTPRQMEVLQLLGQGASTDDIAAELHLSRETVRNHVRHIFRALDVHSRLEAVAVAHERGLLD